MKKVSSVLIALVFLSSLLAGCSSKAGEGTSPAPSQAASGRADINFDEEPYEINFLYLVAAEGANQKNVQKAVSDLAEKEINMKVNLIPMTWGTYLSQISMVLAANEPLDIFPALNKHFSNYIDSQYVVNIADYLEYAPDILEVLGEDAKAGYIGDFLIGFTQMKERAYPAGLVVRKDIFDELGFTVEDFAVTVDDYSSFAQITELYGKVKEKYPNMVCLDGTSVMGEQIHSYVDNMGSNFGVLEDYGTSLSVTNWYESEQYRKFVEIAHDWFTKGYISSDIAVNQDTGEIKMKAGNCFSFITNVKPNTNVEKLAQTGYEVEIIPMSQCLKSSSVVNGGLLCVANASKNPTKAVQFLNWAYTSREFNDLINWGIEGEDWVETPEGLAAYPDGVDATNTGYHNDFGYIYPNQFAGHPWKGNPPDIWDQYLEYNANLLTSKAYGFVFDSTVVATEEAQLNSVLEQYKKDVGFGVIDVDQGIQDFNDALYAAGLQKVMDEKQKQLDDWLAKQ